MKTVHVLCALACALLLLLVQEAAAHMALLYPMPRGGISTKQFDGQVHAWIGFNTNRVLPCNGYGPGPVTSMKAGQVINVSILWLTFMSSHFSCSSWK